MFEKDGYEPNTPEYDGLRPTAHRGDAAFVADRSRYSFYESTINYVFNGAPQRLFEENADGTRRLLEEDEVLDLVGTQHGDVYREYLCATCGKYFRRAAMHIDHIVPIGKHWEQVGPGTMGDGAQSYNDVNNLRLICSECNTSHAFEGGSDTE